MGALAVGFGLGFVVAAQIGPISLLCIRSVLRGTLAVGIAIGAGAAVVDALYATLGVLGAGEVLDRLPGLRLALGLVGAAVIAYLGVKTLWSAFRVRFSPSQQPLQLGLRLRHLSPDPLIRRVLVGRLFVQRLAFFPRNRRLGVRNPLV